MPSSIAARLWILVVALGTAAAVCSRSANAAEPEKHAKGVLFRESFEDSELAKRGWYDGSAFRIAGGSRAGKGCLEYEWGDGESKARGSSAVRHLFEPTDEVAVRYYLKLSTGWGWSGRDYHPHLTHFLTTENAKWHGPAASHLTLYIEPVGGKLRLAAQDIQNEKMPHGLTQGPLKGGYNGQFYDSNEVLFKDDQWHCIEAYFKLNTLDFEKDRPNRDGIVRGWVDGRLVVERTDVILRSNDFPKMKFNQFLMAPYFGPGLLPHAQKLWIDELAVGTKRIGPLAARAEFLGKDSGKGTKPHGRMEEMRPDDLEKVLAENPVAFVPLGTFEHHGWHLPVCFDGIKAHALCERVAQRTGGAVLPTFFYGTGGGHVGYKWTLILPEKQITPILEATLDHLAAQGFKVVVVLTGHYPKEQVDMAHRLAQEAQARHPKVRFIGLTEPEVTTPQPGDRGAGDHAAKYETSIAMALNSAWVRMDALTAGRDPEKVTLPATPRNSASTHDPKHPLYAIHGQDPRTTASKELGEKLVAEIVSRLAEKVEQGLVGSKDLPERSER